VVSPTKSWPVAFKKQGKDDAKPQFCIGVFQCPECKAKFRGQVEPKPEPPANVADLVGRINSIREGLSQTLTTLRAKIGTLETERSSLLTEMEELKGAAESRVDALEAEVGQLREEAKSLREVLGSKANETV